METLVAELEKIATAHEASVAQIPTAWAIAKGTLPIIGVTKVAQVEQAAAAVGIKLSPEEVARLETLGDQTKVNTLREWEREME